MGKMKGSGQMIEIDGEPYVRIAALSKSLQDRIRLELAFEKLRNTKEQEDDGEAGSESPCVPDLDAP